MLIRDIKIGELIDLISDRNVLIDNKWNVNARVEKM